MFAETSRLMLPFIVLAVVLALFIAAALFAMRDALHWLDRAAALCELHPDQAAAWRPLPYSVRGPAQPRSFALRVPSSAFRPPSWIPLPRSEFPVPTSEAPS